MSRAPALKITLNICTCIYTLNIHIFTFIYTCIHTYTCTFHDVCCSKPLATMVSCFLAPRGCFKHFCRFQAFAAQTDGTGSQLDNICHLSLICHPIQIDLPKNQNYDCYCYLIRDCHLKKLFCLLVFLRGWFDVRESSEVRVTIFDWRI